MIRVTPQPEPENFDKKVRQPGLAVFHRTQRANKPYWRRCHNELFAAYQAYCAYLAVRIPRSPASHDKYGGSSVDHFLPKDHYPKLAYEWKNYRLACSAINSRKDNAVGLLDPFYVGEDWFFLNPLTGTLAPNPALSARLQNAVTKTILLLGLNEKRFCDYRMELLDLSDEKEEKTGSLHHESPFLYAEAVRLHLL